MPPTPTEDIIYAYYHDYSRAKGPPGSFDWVAEVRTYGPFNNEQHAIVWCAHNLIEDETHSVKIRNHGSFGFVPHKAY